MGDNMKRLFLLITLTIVIFFAFSIFVYADYSPQYVEMNIDGKNINLEKINILINGEPLISDVSPVLYESRTLVPVKFIIDYLNAQIDWDSKNREVHIYSNDKNITIKIDSKDIIVDGKQKSLPYGVPAKIMNDRTMVPLRFAAEELGFKVDWDSKMRKGIISSAKQDILDIVVNTDNILPKIEIKASGIVYHREMYLDNPCRLVIDIPNTNLELDKDKLDENGVFKLDVNTYPVKMIRASQFSKNPYITRLVLDMDRNAGYTIIQGEKSLEIVFTNLIKNISNGKVNDREAIIIETTNIPEYNVLKLNNPDRMILDIMDSFMGQAKDKYNYKTNNVKGVRVSQFKPDDLYNVNDNIVRVVFDLMSTEESNLIVEQNENKIFFYADNKLINGLNYEKGKEGGKLSIDSSSNSKASVVYDENNNMLKITMPKYNSNIKNSALILSDAFIDNIIIDTIDNNRVLYIKFKENMIYSVISNSKQIDVNFEKKDSTKNNKYTVVIDAGHGGKDPGAISPINGAIEKDLNLKTALELEKKLKELGFNVVMTRKTDTLVNLYERAYIANRNDGDVFISIHYNYNDNKSIKGIQTLYCPSYKSDVKQNNQYPFAEYMHNHLLSGLNAEDKKIVRRPGLVVTRETKMDAVLLELGFLSNYEETKKVCTDAYRKKVAEVIGKALVDYFK